MTTSGAVTQAHAPRAVTRGSAAYARRAVAATERLAALVGAHVLDAGGVALATEGRRRAWRVLTRGGPLEVSVWVSDPDPRYAQGALTVYGHLKDADARRAVPGVLSDGTWTHAYGEADHTTADAAAAAWRAAFDRIAMSPVSDPQRRSSP